VNPTIKYQNLRYKGQPVFRQWNEAKTELRIFSWTVKACAGNTWKVVDRPVLMTVRFRRNSKITALRRAEARLAKMPGMTHE
jgi:hypothetical protein